MASRKSTRRNCRKASRKASRKNRKNSRRASRKNTMMGGAYNPMNLSLSQGQEFNNIHSRQHGGGVPLTGAPVGDQGLLPNELRDIARLGALDMKLSEVVGMRDPDQVAPAAPQAGGGRRKGSRKGRKASRKGRKASRKGRKASRKGRKASRKGRKASRKGSRKGSRKSRRNNMMGGAYPGDGSPLSAPNMLLSASQAAKAGTADFSNPWLRN